MQILSNNIKNVQGEVVIVSDLIDDFNENSIETAKMESLKNADSKYIKYGSYIDSYSVKTLRDIELFHKPKGDYFLINKVKYYSLNDKRINYYSSVLFELLKKVSSNSKKIKKILIIGLGNKQIQCDSLGGAVCDKSSELVPNKNNLFTFQPDVFGKTGFETFNVIKALVNLEKIDLVIVVDALCATSYKRLCSSIQVTNSGISPGSGIKNNRVGLSKDGLGCEIIAIGVPLMIYAGSIVKNALDDISILNNNQEVFMDRLKKYLDSNCGDFIVSLSNIESIVRNFSIIISSALEKYINFTLN